MQDFESFLQNYGYENKEVQTFFIKNNKHYLFLTKRFTRHFNILEHFLSNLTSEKIAWVKIDKNYCFLRKTCNSKQINRKNLSYFFTKRLTLKRRNQ